MNRVKALDAILMESDMLDYAAPFANKLHMESFDSNHFNYNEIMKLESRFPGIITGSTVAQGHNFLLASDKENHRIAMESLGKLGKYAIGAGIIVLIFKILAIFLSDDFTKHGGGGSGGGGGGGGGGSTAREDKLQEAVNDIQTASESIGETLSNERTPELIQTITTTDRDLLGDDFRSSVQSAGKTLTETYSNFNVNYNVDTVSLFTNLFKETKKKNDELSQTGNLRTILGDEELVRTAALQYYGSSNNPKFKAQFDVILKIVERYKALGLNDALSSIADKVGGSDLKQIMDDLGKKDIFEDADNELIEATRDIISRLSAKPDLGGEVKIQDVYGLYQSANEKFERMTESISDYFQITGLDLDGAKKIGQELIEAGDTVGSALNNPDIDAEVAKKIKILMSLNKEFLYLCRAILIQRVKMEKSITIFKNKGIKMKKSDKAIKDIINRVLKHTVE